MINDDARQLAPSVLHVTQDYVTIPWWNTGHGIVRDYSNVLFAYHQLRRSAEYTSDPWQIVDKREGYRVDSIFYSSLSTFSLNNGCIKYNNIYWSKKRGRAY